MITDTFLFDTYAIIEIIEGNEKYGDYLDMKIIINEFIFAELCYIFIRKKYPNAETYLNKYAKYIIYASTSIIKKAMDFRFMNKQKKMSMTDCISYLQAKELGIKFLTGDKEFEGMENIEFVKK